MLPTIRVLVVDDHAIVRECLASMLNQQRGIEVAGAASTGMQAIQEAVRLQPDIVVMDLSLPGMSGFQATQQIVGANQTTQIVVLSAHETVAHIVRALRAGARGYVYKQATGVELLNAIAIVHAGLRYLPTEVESHVVDAALAHSTTLCVFETLSVRERQVLNSTASGLSSAATARSLHLSQKTVDTYRSRLMAKLGLRDRTALIRFAIENDLKSV